MFHGSDPHHDPTYTRLIGVLGLRALVYMWMCVGLGEVSAE